MMKPLLKQLKKRRLALAMKQKDMLLRVGISRQQYQQLESKGNPRLDTLELVAKGLNSELVLIPNEKIALVKELLERDPASYNIPPTPFYGNTSNQVEENALANDPWKGLLSDDE